MKLAFGLPLPFVLTLLFAGGIRLGLGPERGARAAGASVVLAFLIAWGVLWHPGWFPSGPFPRIGHIAFGALLVGTLVDVVLRRRIASLIGAMGVVLVSAWASTTGTLHPMPLTPHVATLVALYSAIALLVLWRLDRMRQSDISVLVVLAMLAFALAALGAVVHDDPLAWTGFMLGLAVIAYALIGSTLALPVGDAVILGAGATTLAIAFALAALHPSVRLGLLLVPLILFAEGTARRVPLPKARISVFLYPLLLAGVCVLPLVLATFVAYVTQP